MFSSQLARRASIRKDGEMTQDDLIGTREAAALLGVSHRTVHRLVAAETLTPAMTAPGGQHGAFLFTPKAVEEILEQRRPVSTP